MKADGETETLSLEDVINSENKEIEEENKPKEVEEIILKNSNTDNTQNDIATINEYNKKILSTKEMDSKGLIGETDYIEQQLIKGQKSVDQKNEDKKSNNTSQQIKINLKSKEEIIEFPEKFKNFNATPNDFIDFMERDYDKKVLNNVRHEYFYLETYQKKNKVDVSCWKFISKNNLVNHLFTNKYLDNPTIKNKNKKLNKPITTKTKITCLIAKDDLVFSGDENGLIKKFSLEKELEYGEFFYNDENPLNYIGQGISVTSMDISSNNELLVCGFSNSYINVFDLKINKCRKILSPSTTYHKNQILALKFLDSRPKEFISSDCNGLVNTIALSERFLSFVKNADFSIDINKLIDYIQPIFVVEILKFTDEEKKNYPFLKTKDIEIVGFGCFDYVFIYEIYPDLIELFKFSRPDYFISYYEPNISFGTGYAPRSKNIIDINREQNQKLNPKAAENCIDVKNINRLVAISWERFINIYVIKLDIEIGIEIIAIVGNFVNSSVIHRMQFLADSILFLYDEEGNYKLLNTGLMSPGEILLDFDSGLPIYNKENEKRALVESPKKLVKNVLKQNYIPQKFAKNKENKENNDKENNIVIKETYFNSIKSNNNKIYILGEDELQYGEVYTWEECLNKLKNASEWINAFIFGLKVYKGEYIALSGVSIDIKKHKEVVGEKLRALILEYVEDKLRIDKSLINENKYNEIKKRCVYIAIEFCIEIESCDFLFRNIAPIFEKKNIDTFLYENLEPFIINGNIQNQIFSERTISKIVNIFCEKKKFHILGQIIKNLYKSISDSESVRIHTTIYDTIFTGLITYCSNVVDNNAETMLLPKQKIYEHFLNGAKLPKDLYWKAENYDKKLHYVFDYENVVNNINLDDLILSKEYLGSLLLWYIYLYLQGHKFPSNEYINEKKHIIIVQKLFLWLINDAVLHNLIEFDPYTLFFIFKKFFMNEYKTIQSIIYDPILFKGILIKEDTPLQEADINKYIEIIMRKSSRADNIYVDDDVYEFICTIATKIDCISKNYLLDALKYVIYYDKHIEELEKIDNNLNKVENEELKYKFDKYCLHLSRYKDKKYIEKLSKIIIAAIDKNSESSQLDNNNGDSSKYLDNEDLKKLLKEIEKTKLKEVKIYLAHKIGDFSKCLDIFLTEFKEQNQIILLNSFINKELSELKNENNNEKLNKYKNEILKRVSEISSTSIEILIELTETWFDNDYMLILKNINKPNFSRTKLKYLEEILYKYKEEEITQGDSVYEEYISILKTQIDLLCSLKFFDEVLPNLKQRNYYPIDYCLKKCYDNEIYDAAIYLQRKVGNISEAFRLVTILIKDEFTNLQKFLNENSTNLQIHKNSINEAIKETNIETDSEDESYLPKEKELKINDNDNFSTKYKKINLKHKKMLFLGIEICESANQILLKEESEKVWFDLLKIYYKLNEKLNSSKDEKESIITLSELEKILKTDIKDIIDRMNAYIGLPTILNNISEIKGNSLSLKELKSLITEIIFSSTSFNHILHFAESILKSYVQESKNKYKQNIICGKEYVLDNCEVCKKNFNNKDKSKIALFKCGHKMHHNCCCIINDLLYCKICWKNDVINENNICGIVNENNIIEDVQEPRKNRNSIHTSNTALNAKKADKEHKKRLKLLGEINRRYFETSDIFENK